MMLKYAVLLLAVFATLSYGQEEENDKEKETIKVLNFSNQGITSLDDHDFSKYRDLEEVDLSNNDIKFLHEDIFLSNTKLKKLNLSGNKNLEVPQYSTLLNANIEEIDLSNCNIEELPTNVFDGLRDLKIINISDNPLIEEESVKEFTLNNLMAPQKLILPYVDEVIIKKICNEVDITIEIKADDYSDSILCKDVRDGTWQNIPKESEANLNIEKRDEEEAETNNDDTQPEPQEVVEPSENEGEVEKMEGNNNEETDTKNHENKDVNDEENTNAENEDTVNNEKDVNPENITNNEEGTNAEGVINNADVNDENINNNEHNANAEETINNEENPNNNENTENNGDDSQTGNTENNNNDGVNLEDTDNVPSSPDNTESQNENEDTKPPPAEGESVGEAGSSDVRLDVKVPDAVDGNVQQNSEPRGQETSNPENQRQATNEENKDAPQETNTGNQGQETNEENKDAPPPSLQRGVFNVPPQQTENVSENQDQKKLENIQQGKADETKAEQTGGAGSSILVILVVAVVIAGAVAFGYKFYKTRTYQAARTTEPVERELKEIVVDKRPNGTSKQDNAIEEKEEEPLMETSQRADSVEIKEIVETTENDLSKNEDVNKSNNQPTSSPYVPTTTPIKPPNQSLSTNTTDNDKTQTSNK